MKRITMLLGAAAVLALSVAGLSQAAGIRAKLQTRRTAVGKILVDRAGDTLFVFTRDHRNMDACVKISGCPGVWPLLSTSGKPLVGPGVNRRLVGTIKVGRRVQVTYAGHPLYLYEFSSGPGDTSYVGAHEFGGFWYAINAAGHVVK